MQQAVKVFKQKKEQLNAYLILSRRQCRGKKENKEKSVNKKSKIFDPH